MDIVTGQEFTQFSPNTLIATVFNAMLALRLGGEGVTAEMRQGYSLVRAVDGMHPLPLDRTLGECGVQSGEALAGRL